jgi:hypothetical protein
MVLVALALVIAFVINLGHYARNFDLYGNPLGPGQESATLGYANEVFSFSATTSNLVRNIGLHLGTPFGQGNTAFCISSSAFPRVMHVQPGQAQNSRSHKHPFTNRLPAIQYSFS